MRKDAKLTFIIGGILLAVLIVYVLVPSKKHTNGVSLDEGNKTDQPAVANSTGSLDANTDLTKPTDSSANAGNAAAPTTAPSGGPVIASNTDPFNNSNDQSKGTAEDKWILALNNGNVPPAMMTSAPPAPGHNAPISTPINTSLTGKKSKSVVETAAADSTADTAKLADSSAGPAAAPVGPVTPVTDSASTTQPSAPPTGKTNTHVVQAGETISSIAKVAYGSANYWPYIIRANPGMVANKIRPGMTINMPAAEDVKSGSAAAASATASGSTASNETSSATPSASETKIDPNTQYQVQAGDSLAKIAMKLYGSSNKWQPIYDLNKEAIGSDPQKLKQKMVLKLPEPPTVKS